MKARRLITLVLCVILVASVVAGCGSGPKVTDSSSAAPTDSPATPQKTPGSATADGVDIDLSETVSFTAMAGFRPQHADFNDMPIIDELNAAANVEFTWELVPDASLVEKRNLALSTGDIPDAMFGMLSDIDLQKNASLFVPLDEYQQYTPNMVRIMKEKPELKQFITLSDGHYYSMAFWHEKPYEGAYNDLYINREWLDACELELPNTIDEFEKMLIAFKTQDPNGNGEDDEIPFSFILNHNYFGLFGMYGVFGSIDNGNRLHIKDGQVYFTANKEEWKNATEWFAKLNSQGLLDTEGFTQDRSMLFAKGKSDPVLIGSLHAFLIDNVVGANRVDSYSYCLPLKNADGKRVARFNPNPLASRNSCVISKKCKNIERLAYWMDLNLTEEYSLQNTYGLFGKQLIKSSDPEYEYEFAIAPEGMSQDDFRFKDAPASFPSYIPVELNNTLKPAPDVARKIGFMNDTSEYLTKEWIPNVLFTDEEIRELATIQSTITDYVLQQQALWISNQSDILKDWDAYCDQLQALNVDRYVEIYQSAVDRYYGK